MWIALILALVTSCEYQSILNCLHQGAHNTECVSKDNCVLIKKESIIASHKLKISGFIIDPQYYTQMASASKCDLATLESCFDENSIKILDCVTQHFCIEYISIDHLPDNFEDSEKLEINENVQDLYKEQLNNKLQNLNEIVNEDANEEDRNKIVEKLEKIQQELDEVEKELGGGIENDKNNIDENKSGLENLKVSAELEENSENSENGKSALGQQEAKNIDSEGFESLGQIKADTVGLVKADATSCAQDCEQLCDDKKNPESCVSNCLNEFCQPSNFISSDYFSVVLTGVVLFLIVFTIFLFIQNKSMRNAIENGDFGIAIYSSI